MAFRDPLHTDHPPWARFLVLVLLVVVPLGAIAILAHRIVVDEQRVAQSRANQRVESRLEEIRLGLEQRTIELGQELARTILDRERTPARLRDLRDQLPLARQLFVLSASGELLFPPKEDASVTENAFLQRTEAIWNASATLYEPPQSEVGPILGEETRTPQGQLIPAGDSLLDLASRRSEGWLSWYWQDGLHLLQWRRAADGAVVGAEIDRVVLLSRLLATLPFRGSRAGTEARIQLIDAKGDPIHNWGAFQPAPQSRPNASLNLAYPLDAWRLHYFEGPTETHLYGQSLALIAGLGVVAVGLALSLLATWLWWSSTKATRDARERVSFVTQVSHELKTPLANIRLYAELLEEDLDTLTDVDTSPSKRLGVIVSESQRLSRLINNILTFTKQQRGDRLPPPEPVFVDQMIQKTLEQFRPALEAKSIETYINLKAPSPVLAQADGLGQVLANLVTNVEKYAASGRWLGLETSQTEQETHLRIEDRGPGIPRRFAERIFDPFYRLSDRLDEGVTGTGIGLAIARTLVESWGGELRLEAPSEGTGAIFIVELQNAQECR